MSFRHSGATLGTTRRFCCILKVSMGGSICHFCKSEKVACVKHRSTALNFLWLQVRCQNKSLKAWAPWTLGCVSKHFFPASPILTALFLLTDSRLKIWGKNRRSITRKNWFCSDSGVKSQTAGFHLPLHICLIIISQSFSPLALSHQPA